MQKDLHKQIDQTNFSAHKPNGFGRWSNGLNRIGRNRPIAFAFVVALSLALGACTGEAKKDYITSIAIGNQQKASNDFVGALGSYETALAEAEKKYGKDSGQVATALGYMGQIYKAQGEWRLAYMTYKRLVPLQEQFEPKARETADSKADFEFIKKKIIEYGITTDDGYGADQIKKNQTKGKEAPKKSKKKHH